MKKVKKVEKPGKGSQKNGKTWEKRENLGRKKAKKVKIGGKTQSEREKAGNKK